MNYRLGFTVVVSLLLLSFSGTVLASNTDGTISGYAWGNNIGWINFGCTNCNAHITDSGLSGYAWSENFGWINLSATQGGVDNNAEGSLSNKAWGEQIGWINFSGVNVSSVGVFSGTATVDEGGSISFGCTNCNVSTDWRPASTRSGGSGGGGGGGSTGGGGGIVYGPPQGPYALSINNGGLYINNSIVTLHLDGGPQAVQMAVSGNLDFVGASIEPYTTTKSWTFSGADGSKIVYAKFYSNHQIASSPISAGVILDTVPPVLVITSIQQAYGYNEPVVISGTSEPDSQVLMIIDNNYGTFPVDAFGNWSITLGVLDSGVHHVAFTPKDVAGNIGAQVSRDFSVADLTIMPLPTTPPALLPQLAPPLAPILRQLEEGIKNFIPNFLKPIAKVSPTPVVTVPVEAPLAFRPEFHYISSFTLSRFVLAPLPFDIALLAQKLPKVQQTFNAIGINKITDVQKLVGANLKLPTLTQTVLPNTSIAAGQIKELKGIPLASLTSGDKELIPSAVLFAKAAGGLVDYNVALSINNQGKTEQTIQAVAGQTLQLVLKPDAKAKQVIGYIVFKSKKYSPAALSIPSNALAASLLFSAPQLLDQAVAAITVPLEGSNVKAVKPQDTNEKRLVISSFAFEDTGDDIFTANVTLPMVDGQYEIVTVMDYIDPKLVPKEITLVTLIDPEGYIYEKNGNLETRIAGAIASLYWLNPASNQYELWPASDFQQENPQVTDVRGTYSFLVPTGYYYLKVDAPGYSGFEGKPFEVKEGSGIHMNVEMKNTYWLLKMLDWKTALLISVVLLLLYNFYRDRQRDGIGRHAKK